MKIQDLMTINPISCGPDTNLAAATELMWNGDCGLLAVVNENGEPIGVVTDRDICIALGTRDQRPSALTVQQVMTTPPITCAAPEDIAAALKSMQGKKIRRLPVVDSEGVLVGIIALHDLFQHAGVVGLSDGSVLATAKKVGEHPVEAAMSKAAAAS